MNTLSPWFHQSASQRGRVRLYCFPYAGGSATVFAGWQKEIGPEIEVCAVQLPGRGTRFHEPSYRSWPELVSALAHALPSREQLPFAFFGHSLGALIAFEVARYCDRNGLPVPARLFVSACDPPQQRDSSQSLHLLPDEALIAELEKYNATPAEVLHNRDLMTLLLPMIRTDFCLSETYEYRNQCPLTIPISVLAGKLDEQDTAGLERSWQLETEQQCNIRWFETDHFFIHHERSLVIQYLRAELLGLEQPNGYQLSR